MDSLFIFRHCIFGTISRDSSESMIYLGGGRRRWKYFQFFWSSARFSGNYKYINDFFISRAFQGFFLLRYSILLWVLMNTMDLYINNNILRLIRIL